MTAFKSSLGPFKNHLSEQIFIQKYQHEGCETWPLLCNTLVQEVCDGLMSKEEIDQLKQFMIDMKFLAGGRYLYYAGRSIKFYNNCFSGDTLFWTKDGLVRFNQVVGKTVEVLSSITGTYLPAEVKEFGTQQLNRVDFSLVRGQQQVVRSVFVTPNHRWPLISGEITENLEVGDVVAVTDPKIEFDREAFIHGMIFADGNVHHMKNHFGHQLRLCGTKNRFVNLFDDATITYPEFAGGDAVVYIKSETNLKKLPEKSKGPNYIANFIHGWVVMDGHAHSMIHSTDANAISWFTVNAALAGYIITGSIKTETRPSNYGERKPLYHVHFQEAKNFAGFKVKEITPQEEQTVYCVVEPQHHQFTLAGGIATGNCFLLKAEEDTREEWGSLAQRATSCLMSGGGIGVDYSGLRPAGKPLRRTGGISSGPIPLMQIINEIGRHVMQGGSRRSAIWAGLNWQHEDISDFIGAKNWTKKIRRLKAEDYNFPAPLDMTNISINFDTTFLQLEELPDIWYDSVRRMCKTGEPGHAYNFGENENDTLRNACTEVTSSYDSDVCNLGSINLSAIGSIEELRSVVGLASKFLVCGTLRADLPYEKVKRVREEHRKIGLGLMGVHEWLLQRGKGYEVDGELLAWLGTYKECSENAARSLAKRLSISEPEKFRAIAPAGTIGILASTTTGIEPLFASAYKRRYLTNGTDWKYEYVVSPIAKRLNEDYGVDVDGIETAHGLSSTLGGIEQRIKFQADIQSFVDMGISSTLNLAPWGTDGNNDTNSRKIAKIIAKYCSRLRGITCYPDGGRDGQPLEVVDYKFASEQEGIVHDEKMDCVGGVCGI